MPRKQFGAITTLSLASKCSGQNANAAKLEYQAWLVKNACATRIQALGRGYSTRVRLWKKALYAPHAPCALVYACVTTHVVFRRENAQDAAAWKLTAWARKLIEAAHNGTDKRGIRRHKAARKIGVSTLCCV